MDENLTNNNVEMRKTEEKDIYRIFIMIKIATLERSKVFYQQTNIYRGLTYKLIN